MCVSYKGLRTIENLLQLNENRTGENDAKQK